jgi:hypothetical protein
MDDLDQAIREAYASAPAVTAWTALELNHSSFTSPARVVLDHGELLSEDPVTWGRRLRLEADAPVQPGEIVTFLSAAIDVTLPSWKDGQQPELTLTIDNVSGSLVPLMKNAISIGEPVSLHVRQYLSHDPDTVHYRLRGLTLRRATASILRIEGKAAFSDLRERIFGRTYTNEEFPSLASR